MIRSNSSALALATLLMACAAPQQERTIEPTVVAPPPGAAPPADDRGFVLSRARSRTVPTADSVDLNIGDKWWRFRGEFLRLNETQTRARDTEVSEVQAPEHFWDQQTSVEAISVWTAVCNECHGGRRKMEDALSMPPPPGEWGRGEGLFFGARRRYADVFNTIYRGGPERKGVKSEMPPWRGKISKELIWSILYFLEYQSGGIEGRFPPSLYPRRESTE